MVYIRGYIDLAVDEGYYALSERELEALDYFDELATSDAFCLNLTLEPGEACFTNNCMLLHRRSAFEDHTDPARRRHLLRLWLVDPDRPMAADVRVHKNFLGIPDRKAKEPITPDLDSLGRARATSTEATNIFLGQPFVS